MRLFHYTSNLHIRLISELGLLPRSPALFLYGEPCTFFTTCEVPDAGHGLSLFKTVWRLEVDTEALPGVRFAHWLTYARQCGVDEVIIQAAVSTGGGPDAAASWWIALDRIAWDELATLARKRPADVTAPA